MAKSLTVKLFCDDTASANASDIASAQTILDVGAKLFGHASLNTEEFNETLEYFARGLHVSSD